VSYEYKFLSFRLEDLPEITKIADKMNKEEKWRLLSVCAIPRTSGNFFSLSAFFEREIPDSREPPDSIETHIELKPGDIRLGRPKDMPEMPEAKAGGHDEMEKEREKARAVVGKVFNNLPDGI